MCVCVCVHGMMHARMTCVCAWQDACLQDVCVNGDVCAWHDACTRVWGEVHGEECV